LSLIGLFGFAAAVNEVAQVQSAGTLVYPAEPVSQRDLFGQ
jgi:hypothetical protein